MKGKYAYVHVILHVILHVCVCARSCTKNLITVWKGGECAIESSRSNLTLDEDDPSWFEAYRLAVWQVEANAKLHAACFAMSCAVFL